MEQRVQAAGVPPPPLDLYTPAELFEGWSSEDALSYGETFDARTYRAAVGDGLRVPGAEDVALARSLHDHGINRALQRAISGKNIVAVMGGHKLARTELSYAVVVEAARELARRGYLLVTGGGPGAMEAAHLGARLADEPDSAVRGALENLRGVPKFPDLRDTPLIDTGTGNFNPVALAAIHRWQVPAFEVASGGAPHETIGIPTWLYGHEPPTPFATGHAKYFENSIREDGLLAIATRGVIFAPGGPGTVQEIFQDAAQNHYRSVQGLFSPMILLDLDRYWTVTLPAEPLLRALLQDADETLLHFVRTAEEVVSAVVAFRPPNEAA